MQHGKKTTRPTPAVRPALICRPETLEPRRLLSCAASALSATDPVAVTPSAIHASAVLPSAAVAPSTGAGQTIVIVDSAGDPTLASDLAAFDARCGIPDAPSVTVVDQTGQAAATTSTDPARSAEISQDVALAHALSPAASILLVQTSSDSASDIQAGVAYAKTIAGNSIISMPWSGQLPTAAHDPSTDVDGSGMEARGSNGAILLPPGGLLMQWAVDEGLNGTMHAAVQQEAAHPTLSFPTSFTVNFHGNADNGFQRFTYAASIDGTADTAAPAHAPVIIFMLGSASAQTASLSAGLYHTSGLSHFDLHAPAQSPGPAAVVAPPTSASGSAAGQTVFNDTLIRHGATAAAAPTASRIPSLDEAFVGKTAPLAASTTAGWVSAVSGALASWTSAVHDAPANFSGIALEEIGRMPATVERAAIAGAAGVMKSPVGTAIASMPARVLYRFASFDPVATFSDAMAAFTRESLGGGNVAATVHQPAASHRAWYITGGVLAVDGLLVTRWLSERAAARKKQKKSLPTSPESPQAGFLPTGL